MATTTHCTRLPAIPNELILEIATYLDLPSYLCLLRTCPRTQRLLTPSVPALHSLTPLPNTISDARTPLHFAAAHCNLPLLTSILTDCKRLSGGGMHQTTAAVNRTDIHGLTPLLSAIPTAPTPSHRLETVQLLLQHGADPNIHGCLHVENDGLSRECWKTPLYAALAVRDYPVIEALLEAGAEVGQEKHSDHCKNVHPLHTAVVKGDTRAVKLMLHIGKPSVEEWWENYAMQWAVDYVGWEDMRQVFEQWMGTEKWAARQVGRMEYREKERHVRCGDGKTIVRTERVMYDLLRSEVIPMSEAVENWREKTLSATVKLEGRLKMRRYGWSESSAECGESSAGSREKVMAKKWSVRQMVKGRPKKSRPEISQSDMEELSASLCAKLLLAGRITPTQYRAGWQLLVD